LRKTKVYEKKEARSTHFFRLKVWGCLCWLMVLFIENKLMLENFYWNFRKFEWVNKVWSRVERFEQKTRTCDKKISAQSNIETSRTVSDKIHDAWIMVNKTHLKAHFEQLFYQFFYVFLSSTYIFGLCDPFLLIELLRNWQFECLFTAAVLGANISPLFELWTSIYKWKCVCKNFVVLLSEKTDTWLYFSQICSVVCLQKKSLKEGQ
jgi:hypothetical protein